MDKALSPQVIDRLRALVINGGEEELVEAERLAGGLHHHVFAAHEDEDGEPLVVKLYSEPRRGEAEREWRALTLLKPLGIAPEPISFHDDARFPAVVMSYVRGEAKASDNLGEDDILTMATAHLRIHEVKIPDATPPALNHPARGLLRTERFLADYSEAAAGLTPDTEGLDEAWSLATEWVKTGRTLLC